MIKFIRNVLNDVGNDAPCCEESVTDAETFFRRPEPYKAICLSKQSVFRTPNVLSLSVEMEQHNVSVIKYHVADRVFITTELFKVFCNTYIHTYMPLTLYPRRGSRDISNIPPRHPRFTKIS
jgi:hypothetical protein